MSRALQSRRARAEDDFVRALKALLAGFEGLCPGDAEVARLGGRARILADADPTSLVAKVGGALWAHREGVEAVLRGDAAAEAEFLRQETGSPLVAAVQRLVPTLAADAKGLYLQNLGVLYDSYIEHSLLTAELEGRARPG